MSILPMSPGEKFCLFLQASAQGIRDTLDRIFPGIPISAFRNNRRTLSYISLTPMLTFICIVLICWDAYAAMLAALIVLLIQGFGIIITMLAHLIPEGQP